MERSPALLSPDLTPVFSSLSLSTSSRPSAQRPASWLCGSAAWKSPTKTSRSPRKTSCTRSRRARRRGFTSNRHSHHHHHLPRLLSAAVWTSGGDSRPARLPPNREFWYILCMSCLVYPTPLLPLYVKTTNKRTKKCLISLCVTLLFVCLRLIKSQLVYLLPVVTRNTNYRNYGAVNLMSKLALPRMISATQRAGGHDA